MSQLHRKVVTQTTEGREVAEIMVSAYQVELKGSKFYPNSSVQKPGHMKSEDLK